MMWNLQRINKGCLPRKQKKRKKKSSWPCLRRSGWLCKKEKAESSRRTQHMYSASTTPNTSQAHFSQVKWPGTVAIGILTLGRKRQENQKFKVILFEFRLCLKNKKKQKNKTKKTNKKTQTTTKTMRTSDWTTKKTASQVCSVREQEEQTLQSWDSPHLLVSHSMPESLKSSGPPTHRSY